MMTFDAHSDLLYDVTRRRLAGEHHVLERHHLEPLRRGNVEGLALALWPGTGREPFWPDPDPIQRLRQMLRCTREEWEEGTPIALVRSWEEAEQAKKRGQIYAFLSVEGMDGIGDLAEADRLWDAGVRMGMLTWNGENLLGCGASGDRTQGLTELGRRVVHRMQERRILVDVSHLNEGGFWDVMRETQGPVLASHSNCRALCDHPRNLTDEQLRAIRDTGGVVGLNTYGGFLHGERAQQTAEQLARHAVHMAEVMGIDHVGCGLDFCGWMGPGNESASDLQDPSDLPHFFDLLERMGMNRAEREGIAAGNFRRLLQTLENKS